MTRVSKKVNKSSEIKTIFSSPSDFPYVEVTEKSVHPINVWSELFNIYEHEPVI